MLERLEAGPAQRLAPAVPVDDAQHGLSGEQEQQHRKQEGQAANEHRPRAHIEKRRTAWLVPQNNV
jgi:hypothetical protein